MDAERIIAYFSMEIGLDVDIPTYSGGLGILAGDTVRAAADLSVPMVAVTLLHRKGYFHQRLEADGGQREEPVEWAIDDSLEELNQRVTVTVEQRTVQVRAWKLDVTGVGGFSVPAYFLETDLEENTPEDRKLTDHLYGGDDRYRLSQEIVLGFGGLRMLRALGHNAIERFHMNEGHSSFLTLALLDERLATRGTSEITQDDVEAVRRQCIFTTHTPVPAGHDRFSIDLADRVLGHHAVSELRKLCCFENDLNMTYLALNLSRYINGVAKRHGEVARHLFATYSIDAITNGVHAAMWTSPPFADLFDAAIPGWRGDSFSLRYALGIPGEKVWQAHLEAKRRLLRQASRRSNAGMDLDILTIGVARRMTAYKRPDLIFQDVERLRRIRASAGPLQILFAGKAHPRDEHGKDLIRRIHRMRDALGDAVRVAFLPNYDIELGRLLTAGVDLWLNTPQPPLEASGTSGMKAALNGVPSLSVLDGWWLEGCIEGVTGWAIGERDQDRVADSAACATALYDKLEHVVMPMFYEERTRYIDVMRHAIALNGSFFNTHRMVQQYVVNAYL